MLLHCQIKFGNIVFTSTYILKVGEIVATSAIDITGEGWQNVSFSDFGQRVAVGLATMAATDQISKLQAKNKCRHPNY